jgi:hypothetical protein
MRANTITIRKTALRAIPLGDIITLTALFQRNKFHIAYRLLASKHVPPRLALSPHGRADPSTPILCAGGGEPAVLALTFTSGMAV